MAVTVSKQTNHLQEQKSGTLRSRLFRYCFYPRSESLNGSVVSPEVLSPLPQRLAPESKYIDVLFSLLLQNPI